MKKSNINLCHGVWIEINAFGDQQSHLSRRNVPDRVQEDPPRPLVRRVPPPVRPAQDDRVGFHATQAASLDAGMRAKYVITN